MKPALVDDADFVIVGTGAGGATAARVLQGGGASVIMLEEGPHLTTDQRPRELVSAMGQSFRDFATTATRGPVPFPILQGRMVGGSTAINSGIIWRLPEDVRTDWRDRFGLDALTDAAELDRVFKVIEDELGVTETSPGIMGPNGLRMKAAAEALGLPGRAMHRNTKQCIGRGQCLQGCPGEARQSMDVSYVPRAIKDGARLHANARVTRVIIEGRRATGVEGEVIDPASKRRVGRFEITARRGVIVAGGAIQTPALLRRSGMRGLVGDRLQLHPGAALVGRFDEPVGMNTGATQAYEVPMRDRGFKVESLTLPPEMIAARLPGVGAEWQARIAELDHYAHWVAMVRMQSHGRVRPGFGGDVAIHYTPTRADLKRVQEAVALISRMMFAAGAREVYHGIARRKEVLRDPSEVKLLEEGDLAPADLRMVASHLFGTACAGADASKSVVNPALEAHEVRGLYVMDASVFPTNLGVNPQHSIMAMVWQAAEKLANTSTVRVAS